MIKKGEIYPIEKKYLILNIFLFKISVYKKNPNEAHLIITSTTLILIKEFIFNPSNIQIFPGTNVIWKNTDQELLTITSKI